MHRSILPIAIAIAFVFSPAPASADSTTVYRKKNADGTTSYSQQATAGAESRTVNSSDPVLPETAEAAAPKSVSDQNCDTASANLELYNSGSPLMRRTGEGEETVALTAEEMSKGKAEAEQQIAAFCGEPTAQ